MSLNAKRTQEFVPIQEIRDGIIVLKNGDLRAIILANSINLSLKSSEEQRAVLLRFQDFLNTLDFQIQISIQSRKLDIKPYILLLESRMKVQNEPLLKIQTREYIEFIKQYVESHNIMTKNFFIIVPYTQKSLSIDSDFFSKIFNKKNKQLEKMEAELDFEEKRSQIEQRVSVIMQGLQRCGDIKSVQLGTEEAIEVFYKVFNPGELEGKIELEN